MDMDPYEIKELPTSQLSSQQMAKALMYNIPSRGWDNYDGFDETLRIGIKIAEGHHSDGGSQELLEQYGTAGIVQDMKGLRAALQVLAEQGPFGLNQQDRRALSMGKLTLDGMIRQTLIIADSNKPGGHGGGIAPEFLSPDSDAYWQERIRNLTRGSVEDERNVYSKSRQFGHYLADAQKVLSAICHNLGIQEARQRGR